MHYPEIELDFAVQRLLIKPAMYALKSISSSIDLFIAHTKLEMSWLRNYGVSDSKVRIVFTPHIPNEIIEYVAKSRKNNEVLFLSRVVPRKGVHVLVKAFNEVLKDIPNAKLIIAGREDPKYGKYLRRFVTRLKLEEVIHFLGSIDESYKIKLISSVTVFCLPTLADYHPIALLEAQALGTPVISTRVGAIPEIVIDGETGLLVEPSNDKQLAKAIKRLLRDEELHAKMSAKAREWAKDFTLDRAVTRLEKEYRALGA